MHLVVQARDGGGQRQDRLAGLADGGEELPRALGHCRGESKGEGEGEGEGERESEWANSCPGSSGA